MKLFSPLLLAFLLLLSGCGNNEVQTVYRVHKDSVIVIDKDVIFEYNGVTHTAKEGAASVNSAKGDYLEIVSYINGNFKISSE